MCKYYKNINLLSILLVLLLAYPLKAECDMTDFNIEELFFNESIVGYYLGGFDVSSGSSNVLLFEYLISGSSNCYSSTSGPTLTLEYDIEIFSPSLEFYTPQSFVSGAVTFKTIYGPIRLKNTDINFATSSVEGAIEFEVGATELGVDNQKIESMANYIMTTGKVPNGTYVFNFRLKEGLPNGNGDVLDSYTRDIEIYEPTFLDLLSPGYKNISDANESPLFNSYPVFTWNADMCSSCDYGIRVSEYNQMTHSSFSDALNDISSLPSNQSIDFYPMPTSSSVFQYPSSGGFDLEAGKFYVWQIKRSYGTTVGAKEDYSDIFIFKVSSFQSSESSSLDFLKDLIGDSDFLTLFGSGGILEGYNLSGIKLNGENSSEQDIQQIIIDLQQGNSQLIDYTVD